MMDKETLTKVEEHMANLYNMRHIFGGSHPVFWDKDLETARKIINELKVILDSEKENSHETS